MAVFDDYVTSLIQGGTGRMTADFMAQGSKNKVSFLVPWTTTAAHDAASIYRVLKAIPCTAVPYEMWLWTDGVTAMSDVDVGLYQVGAGGAEVGTDVLAAAIDLSSAVLKTARKDAMIGVTPANYGLSLWELAAQTVSSRFSHYDIGIKSNADLSEADQIVFQAEFLF